MEIHWHHTQWLSEDGREEIEARIRELAEQGSNDIIDVRISGNSSRHNHGEQEVRIPCEARGKEIVAARTSDSLGQALEIPGEGTVIGFIYRRPLLTDGNFSHEGSLGLQHKKFDNKSEFGNVQFTGAEVESMPLEIGYSFNRAAPGSSFFGSITLVQEIGDNDDEYDEDRLEAESGWTAWRYNITYDRLFAEEYLFHVGFSGQLTDALLISGEQFGVEFSIGYKAR